MSAAGDKVPPGIQNESGYHPIRVPKPETKNLISDLGHYGGLHAAYRTEDLIQLELKSVEVLVNLAKSVNIANEVQHLVVRDLLPDRDFRDGNGNAISGRAWVQPWSGFYEQVETDVPIYKINRNVDYHNKVYAFWGLRYVNRGPADTDAVMSSTSMTIKDSVNTYDVWDTEALDVHKESPVVGRAGRLDQLVCRRHANRIVDQPRGPSLCERVESHFRSRAAERCQV